MSRIEDAEIRARKESILATEARELLHALQTLMNAAGVTDGWADAEPRGVDAAFATVVVQLTTDSTFGDDAADMAARDLIDFYLDDEG